METVDRIEEKMLKRRREVIRVLTHLKRDSDEVTATRQIDWLDEASDANMARTANRLNELYRVELNSIERALARIRTGVYGACAACHRNIERMRLEVCPDTEFCSGCAALREEFVAAA